MSDSVVAIIVAAGQNRLNEVAMDATEFMPLRVDQLRVIGPIEFFAKASFKVE